MNQQVNESHQDQPEAIQRPDSQSASTTKLANEGLEAIAKLAGVAEAKGMRNTTLAAGIVILVLAIAGTFFPNQARSSSVLLAGTLAGGALILGVLITSSLEYRQQLKAEMHRIECEVQRYEAETQFRIAQIKATEPTTPQTRLLPPPK
jgi:hypothetical protein